MILVIYNWWKNYPNRYNTIEKMYLQEDCSYDLIEHFEQVLDKEETQMLINLINIRKRLWS